MGYSTNNSFKGYRETTFGELRIGDKFQVEEDFTNKRFPPSTYQRIKVGEKEAKYTGAIPMALPENNKPPERVVFVLIDSETPTRTSKMFIKLSFDWRNWAIGFNVLEHLKTHRRVFAIVFLCFAVLIGRKDVGE